MISQNFHEPHATFVGLHSVWQVAICHAVVLSAEIVLVASATTVLKALADLFAVIVMPPDL